MIAVSDSIALESISISDHSKLLDLINYIYPPAYKYLWKNEDCNFYFERFYSLTNLKAELAESKSEYYFVQHGNNLVGILRIHFEKVLKSMPEKSACYINRIYLSEEAQGKGIAGALFNWVERKARLNKNEVIWLEAMDSKAQALRFYEKQGLIKSHMAYLDFEPLHDDFRGMHVMYKLLNDK